MPRLPRKNLLIILLTLACLVALTLAYHWFETRYLRTFDERAAVFSGAELQSVAYTHLDVYKRQLDRIMRDAADYAGFNLLLGDRQQLWHFNSREGRPRQLRSGIYGMSNACLLYTSRCV